MTESTADVVICGAGIGGIAAAYHLAVRQGVPGVVLVDERAPLTLTSDKSTESYRNWWPGPDGAMTALMNRSIDLLEELADESGNVFNMSRRGYLFVTADEAHVAHLRRTGEQCASYGAGPLRVHAAGSGSRAESGAPYVAHTPDGYADKPIGADLLLDPALIRRHFPYLSQRTVAALHARRCGWFSGQQLGMYLLEQAKAHGLRFLSGRVTGVDSSNGRVNSVRVAGPDGTAGETLSTRCFVNSAGPMLKPVGELLGVTLPVFSERHIKLAFPDRLHTVGRDAPMMIWEDPQSLDWPDDLRAELAANPETRRLLDGFPAGVHGRPEGGADSDNVLLLWTYDPKPVPEVFPLVEEPHYAELVLRGMTAIVPGMSAYLERMPRGYVDGGYYTKTRENRLLACPLPVEGSYVLGALSGFGLMSSIGAGEVLAAHVTGNTPPAYAPAFHLSRYEDPAYLQLLDDWGDGAQL